MDRLLLHPVQASVLIADAPMGYSPPRGPAVHLQLRYNHREENPKNCKEVPGNPCQIKKLLDGIKAQLDANGACRRARTTTSGSR